MSDSLSTAPAVRSAYRGAEPRSTDGRARLWSFLLVRLTGLALTILVLGHFTLTHIVNDVADTDSAFVARRWGSALWVAWDWLMLLCAIAHGAAGVWVAIDDYTPETAGRRRRHRVLLGISAVALALGTITIVAATR
ncbi:MAG TPA: succinate dehydrogenase [Thermomicrobiales bacterium]|jgi:succinate dehydrogenase / fumarate reductase membrane anchor subunit